MGMNYYLKGKPPCVECKRDFDRQHIGKSSMGWCFSLHVDPPNGIRDLLDWMLLWDEPGAEIVDEYGHAVSRYDMLKKICLRSGHKHTDATTRGLGWTEAEFARNHAIAGPYGLARSRIDGVHCIGHGDGTWDLIVGDFS